MELEYLLKAWQWFVKGYSTNECGEWVPFSHSVITWTITVFAGLWLIAMVLTLILILPLKAQAILGVFAVCCVPAIVISWLSRA